MPVYQLGPRQPQIDVTAYVAPVDARLPAWTATAAD